MHIISLYSTSASFANATCKSLLRSSVIKKILTLSFSRALARMIAPIGPSVSGFIFGIIGKPDAIKTVASDFIDLTIISAASKQSGVDFLADKYSFCFYVPFISILIIWSISLNKPMLIYSYILLFSLILKCLKCIQRR